MAAKSTVKMTSAMDKPVSLMVTVTVAAAATLFLSP